MAILEYTFRPSNLPSEIPTYSPVTQNKPLMEINDVSERLSDKIGQPPLVIKQVLSELATVLPSLLAEAEVNLGFVNLNLSLSDSVTDNSISYTSSNAPLVLKTKINDKNKIIAQARPSIIPVKNAYIPLTPNISKITSYRYDGLTNVVPVTSAYDVVGMNLSLHSSEELRIYTASDPEFTVPSVPSKIDDILKSSKQHIIVSSNPYDMVVRNDNNYAKLSWYDTDNNNETIFPTIYKVVRGGTSHLGVTLDPDNVYSDSTYITNFKFTLTNDVLSVAIKSAGNPAVYGTAVTVTNNSTLLLDDASDTGVKTITTITGSNTVAYYTELCQNNGDVYEVVGFRE